MSEKKPDNKPNNPVGCSIFCILLLIGIVWACVASISSLKGFLLFLVLFSCVTVGLFLLFLIHSLWKRDDKQAVPSKKISISASSPFAECKKSIDTYLRQNKSTPYFREKLNVLAKRIATCASRCETIKEIITIRFCPDGLSYSKFAGPVVALQDYLINLTNNIVYRMRIFNEEEYQSRIEELQKAGNAEEAAKYQEIEKEYMEYMETTLAAFDDASLRLDRLALEISKLGEGDTEKALHIMQDLDDAIKDTKLYIQ
jgi:hypothetical protein